MAHCDFVALGSALFLCGTSSAYLGRGPQSAIAAAPGSARTAL